MFACAAFSKESRMKFADPKKPHRKSGGMGHPLHVPTSLPHSHPLRPAPGLRGFGQTEQVGEDAVGSRDTLGHLAV